MRGVREVLFTTWPLVIFTLYQECVLWILFFLSMQYFFNKKKLIKISSPLPTNYKGMHGHCRKFPNFEGRHENTVSFHCWMFEDLGSLYLER